MKKNFFLRSMSKTMLMPVFLLFVGAFATTELSAQNKPAAQLSNGVLQLPTNIALASVYELSIASFGFQTENEAIQFFNSKSQSGLYSFRVRFNEQKVYIYLQKQDHPNWTLTEWNNVLNTKTTNSPLLN